MDDKWRERYTYQECDHQEALDKELINLLRETTKNLQLPNQIEEDALLEKVQSVLNRGANPNASLKRGLRPLHYACWRRRLDLCHALLQAGASLDVRDEAGYSCVHMAAEAGNNEVLKWLLEKEADPDGSVKASFEEEERLAEARARSDGYYDGLEVPRAPHPLFLALRDGRQGSVEVSQNIAIRSRAYTTDIPDVPRKFQTRI